MTSSVYCAVGTVSASVFTESTATAYVRIFTSFATPALGKAVGFGPVLNFNAATSAVVTTYNALAFYSASTGGSPLIIYPLNATFSMGLNTPYVVNPYSVVIDFIDNVTPQNMVLDCSGAQAITGVAAAPLKNQSASTDPGVANDITQSYDIGSTWFNTTANRVWTCQSNATGAATWLLSGVIPGGSAPTVAAPAGAEPSSMLTQFGSSLATFPEEGNINRQVVGVAVSPGTIGVDSVLAVYSLPANAFDIANRGITITAAGAFASNTHSKDCKIIVNPTAAVVGSTVGGGGTTICDTGAVTTNGTGWQLMGSVFKYGAAASNTQLGIHNQAQIGAAVASMLAPSLITAVESSAILIAVTGNALTTTTDILFNWLEVNAMN